MPTPIKWGSEFLVSLDTTTGQYSNPSVASLSNGRFVVTWCSDSLIADSSSGGIYGQLFNADGSALGSAFLVNTTTTRNQDSPAVTVLPDGRFVVAWDDDSRTGGDTLGSAIRAQVFGFDGSKSGSELLVNSTTTNDQDTPAIATLSDGRFVVTWATNSVAVGPQGFSAQIFNADGSRSGTEFSVGGFSGTPTISALSNGRFVVAGTGWGGSYGDSSLTAVIAQVFNANGSTSGSGFLVNTTTFDDQIRPVLTSLSDGRFVASWVDDSNTGPGDTSLSAIRAQIFNVDGSKSGTEFVVNTSSTSIQEDPTITALRDGRFVVAWEDWHNSDIRAQVFDANGSRSGAEFVVPSVAGSGHNPVLSMLADGRFVAVWEGWMPTGGNNGVSGVVAQIFDPRVSAVNLSGTPGDDQYVGSDFSDTLIGGAGNDVMGGGGGQDNIDGGDGVDRVEYVDKALGVNVTLNGANWSSVTVGGVIEDSIRNFENIRGGSGNDVLVGDAQSNKFRGGAGQDYLYGRDGNDELLGEGGVDVIQGEGGDDLLYGGSELDYLFGGAGNDTLYGEAGVDVLQGEGGDDLLIGGDEGDYFYGGVGNDRAFGDNGNDIFVMESGNDVATGGAGQDYFYMGDGNDWAFGNDGVDVFLGGAGNDSFEGGAGVDYAWGEAGHDLFALRKSSGVMVVQDFTAGGVEDAVLIASDTGITTFAQATAASTYYAGMNTTIVTLDADTAVWLVGVNKSQLTNADFSFFTST
jgi:Ca2+-binding RTX toxin-like protein